MLFWISGSPWVWVPALSQLVLSFISSVIPSLAAISVRRSKSNFLPSTGFSSKRQSPVSTSTPSGVRITTAVLSGMEWFTRTSSTLKLSPSCTRSWASGLSSWYSGVNEPSVSSIVRFSIPMVNLLAYTGAGIWLIKWRKDPIWSRCPWVNTCPRILCLFSSK